MKDFAWLLDTNVLLRFYGPSRSVSSDIYLAVTSLISSGEQLFYTSQVLAEFWNVSTRPKVVNGLGRSIMETDAAVGLIEEKLLLAADNPAVHYEWRRLIVDHQVSGAQVHDARIAATMAVNRISHLLTQNVRDFRRYPGITVHTPQDFLRL